MIHLDYADGTSAWLTAEELKEKHPELHAIMNRPTPHKEYGEKLKQIRIKHRLTLREMAKRVGCRASELSNVEIGVTEASMELVEEYQRLQQERISNTI